MHGGNNRTFCDPLTLNPLSCDQEIYRLRKPFFNNACESLSDPTHRCVDITVGRRESEVGKVPDGTQRLGDDLEEIRKMAAFDRPPIGNRVYKLTMLEEIFQII